jgi:hypothetical protein
MENPQRGQLKDREVVKGLPYYDVSYCMYSDWGYEKRTRIWTNKKNWNNLICDKSGDCGNMIESSHKKVLGNGYEIIDGEKVLCNTKESRNKLRKHKKVCDGGGDKRGKHKAVVAGGGKKGSGQINIGGGTDRLDRYRIPPNLIYELFLD